MIMEKKLKSLTTEIKSMVDLMKETCIANINVMTKRGNISIGEENIPKLKGVIDAAIDDCFTRAYSNVIKAAKKDAVLETTAKKSTKRSTRK